MDARMMNISLPTKTDVSNIDVCTFYMLKSKIILWIPFLDHGDPCVYDVDTILSLNLLGGLISVTLGIEGICEPTCRCVRNFCIAI